MKNKKLESRLYNFKFESAKQYLKNESEEVVDLVIALSSMFEDSGWFDGDMAIIIENAIENIGVKL